MIRHLKKGEIPSQFVPCLPALYHTLIATENSRNRQPCSLAGHLDFVIHSIYRCTIRTYIGMGQSTGIDLELEQFLGAIPGCLVNISA